jgi:RHS repeat-associated protein
LRRTVFSSVFTLVSTSWCLAGAGAAQAQFPNLARGFSPSGMFDVGGIDVVNGFNGNMVIRIPIGKSYPVGGTMGSYSFSLVYNSRVWDHVANPVPGCTGSVMDTLAIASPHDNAGLGWRFSLGQLDGDTSPIFQLPDPPSPHAYHGMDGSQHYLFNYLAQGQGGSVQQTGMEFSNDGSYLRYSPAAGTIEFPDGNVHTFDANGFPTSIKDPFGNGLTITDTTTDPSCPGNTFGAGTAWQISDGYRTHKVCLIPTGYAYPEQTQVIDHIDLAAFGPNAPPATYKFRYNDTNADGSGFHTIRLTGYGTTIRACSGVDPYSNPRVYLLTTLLLPDGTSYSMPSAAYNQPPPPNSTQPAFPGQLTSMGLPTSGSIAWTYELKLLPSPHSDTGPLWYTPVWSNVIGVSQRSLHDTSGQLVGTWQYSSANVAAKANELVNQVLYPSPDPVQAAQGASGHKIVTYYAACVYGVCTNEDGSQTTFAVDYGLPYSRRRPDGTGEFLSQEIYAAGGSSPLRQVFANYEYDGPIPAPGSTPTPVFANQRPQAHRTVYLDDPVPGQPGNYTAITTASSGYDGLGHYRIAAASDNIGAGTSRTERTDWNPNSFGLLAPSAPPGPTAPWILDTYDYKEQQEGAALIRQETRFDRSTGFLQCQRRLATGATHGPNDVIVAYQPDSAGHGQVASEQWYGGDAQSLMGADCGSLPSSPVYSYNHSYSAGVRHLTTTQVTVTVNNTPTVTTLNLLDADIDAPSGLVSAARDPAGRATTFTYDAMARPLTSTPPGAATTNVTYRLSSTSPPSIERSVGAPFLEDESWFLDGLGRTVQHTVILPGNVSSSSFITLNAMGWKTLETEPSSGTGAKGTQYLFYDPFGRPAAIVAADGKPTYFTYHGVRRVVRSQRVWNGTREAPVNTTEEYDGLGRLRRMIEPDGTITRYAYDAAGRLSMVINNAGANNYQTRTFHFDGRGFLTRESYPELGPNPQNPLTYRAITYHYDAKGNLTRKETPTGTQLYGYDEAGRLLSVGSTQMNPLRKFSYGTGSTAGEVIEAQAFNYRMVSVCSAIEVRQDFSYETATGRLSGENTSLWQGGGALESWTQSYFYDGADRITQVSYPTCTACSSPTRSVTTTYSLGRPTSVSSFANPITYNGNGTLATIHHANGVVFTEMPDVNGMLRPGLLRSDLGSTELWPPESYFYDGAGNIKAIGAKSFVYDVNSRIVSATVPSAGAQPYQSFTYDPYNNLTLIFRGANPTSGSFVSLNVDNATNRLTGATYDDSGEVLNTPAPTMFSWTWDVLGQATSVTTDTESWVHTYDAAGERVWSWRTSPSRLDTYALRGKDRKLLSLFTKTGSNYTWEDYAYREGSLLGASYSTGCVRHFDVDHLGSVRLETNGGAACTQSTTYRDFLPYGEEATPPGGGERMKFAGQERDLGNLTSTADDIDYMHARYFRPIWGRFLSPDPLLDAPRATRHPQLWNRYAYGAANPMKYLDPSGAFLEIPVCNGIFDCAEKIISDWLDQRAPPPKADPKALEAQGYTDQDVTATSAINPIEQAGQVQGTLNAATTKVLAAGATAAIVAVATVASDGAINVLAKGLEHVVARHTVVGMLTTGKSVFRAEENIVTLIKAASSVNPTLQPNGNLRFVMNAGRAIGYDVKAGGPTSFYTVITDRARNLITAFPGL